MNGKKAKRLRKVAAILNQERLDINIRLSAWQRVALWFKRLFGWKEVDYRERAGRISYKAMKRLWGPVHSREQARRLFNEVL